jgi:hypothetical protein
MSWSKTKAPVGTVHIKGGWWRKVKRAAMGAEVRMQLMNNRAGLMASCKNIKEPRRACIVFK